MINIRKLEAELWEMLRRGTSLERLVQTMMNVYDVQENVLREDIQEFLDKLIPPPENVSSKDIFSEIGCPRYSARWRECSALGKRSKASRPLAESFCG